MTESHAENATGTWRVQECPFAIEYSLRALDDIRLAVMDAFFSLPRGGAEIGGVLVGKFAGDRVVISEYVALDCEHAMGPSFTLSERDEEKLDELLAEVRKGRTGVPVGWYHSHTRSEIFLSDADLKIQHRFFPEPWQVALVLKPHTFQPVRCGFFFRDLQGGIQAAATYREFTLDPLPMQPIPSGSIPLNDDFFSSPPSGEELGRKTIRMDAKQADQLASDHKVIEIPRPAHEYSEPAAQDPATPKTIEIPIAGREPASEKPTLVEPPRVTPPVEPVAVVTPTPPPVSPPPLVSPPPDVPRIDTKPAVEPPKLLLQPGENRSGRGLKIVLAVALGAAIGVIGFQTRQQWAPRLAALFTPAAPGESTVARVGLTMIDNNGQLQIQWNGASDSVRQATAGRLTITDGDQAPREIKLDGGLLQSGHFTYARQAETVNVVLTLDEPNGEPMREVAAFAGNLPVRAQAPVSQARNGSAAEAASLKKELAAQVDLNRAATEETTRLRKDLAAQVERTRRLQKQLDDAQAQLREQQRKRLATQIPK